MGVTGLVIIGVFAAIAVLAPVLAPYEPDVRSGLPFERPGRHHLLGTDDVGYDLLSELLWGARVSLGVGVAAGIVAVVVGGLVGMIAGQRRGWVDAVLMRGVDLSLALPFVPLLIVLAAYLGQGLENEVLALGVLLWAHPARVVRSQVLSVRQRVYVTSARAYGARSPYLLRRHVLPAVTPLLIAEFVRAVTVAVLLEATLGFLGLGLPPPTPDWGTMVADARDFISRSPWAALFPAAAIASLVVGLNLMADGIRQESARYR